MYILSHIKKFYFIHFCCLLLKLSKVFHVPLRMCNFQLLLVTEGMTKMKTYKKLIETDLLQKDGLIPSMNKTCFVRYLFGKSIRYSQKN